MDRNVKTLLEKARATATYAAEKATQVADAASRMAGDMAMQTKLNLQVFDMNSEIDAVYKEIGRIVYLVHTGEGTDEGLDDRFAQIDERLAKVAELKAAIADCRTTVICPQCGKECGRDDAYCVRCGNKLS